MYKRQYSGSAKPLLPKLLARMSCPLRMVMLPIIPASHSETSLANFGKPS